MIRTITDLIPLEDEECKTFVEYLEILESQGKIDKFTHTANETFTKSWKQKNRNKAMGVRPGIPDYIIIISLIPKRLVFIEMKRKRFSTITKDQKDWIRLLNGCEGVRACICKGYDEAKVFIDGYLKKL